MIKDASAPQFEVFPSFLSRAPPSQRPQLSLSLSREEGGVRRASPCSIVACVRVSVRRACSGRNKDGQNSEPSEG